MKKHNGFDLFENADKDTIEKLSAHLGETGGSEREKIYRMAVKKSAVRQGQFCGIEPAYENEEVYELKGVDFNMKKNRLKPFMAAAACLLIAGAVLCGTALIRHSGKKNDSEYYSNIAATDENGKTILKVAYVALGTDTDFSGFRSIISDFNASSDSYKAELVPYSNEEGHSAINKLNEDLADGIVPDIIWAEPCKLRTLYDHGYLEDLNNMIDNYNGIKRNEIVPSLLNVITINGHIPCIPDSIHAQTYCMETSLLGEGITNWNFEQAVKLYNSLSEDDKKHFLELNAYNDSELNIFWSSRRETLADYFITGGIISSMDYENYEFKPENGLRQALEFIYSLPDDSNEYDEPDLTFRRPVLTNAYVSVCSSYSTHAIGYHGGNDISLVGYPTENGTGVLGSSYLGIGIMKNCPSKQGAWDFINYTAITGDDQYRTPTSNLPLRASLYQKDYEADKMSKSSINCGMTKDGGLTFDQNEIAFYITESQKQQLKDYIDSLDFTIYQDEEIENIIREECAYVVRGERTPDQCISILTDRIGTYIDENR
ncbi:MAG: carbohydrate ABC transporter substrate-binding protein [Ruminococcus sp.]|nr:carbohydrate ABC transporter substrate-binding protein [Ruminococcus sp.]